MAKPSVARIYNALLGDGDSYAHERVFAEQAERVLPIVGDLARMNREFLGRVVRTCLDLGVNQFLDIGSGLPTMGNVHEVAESVDPAARVVYVDHDAVAVAHSRLLLQRTGLEGRHAAVQERLQHPDLVWEKALGTGVLDPSRPVALVLVAILHFARSENTAADDLDAHAAVRRYRELLPPGSVIGLSHVTTTGVPEVLHPQLTAFVDLYRSANDTAVVRTRPEIEAFFGDWDMVSPGLVWLPQWRPARGHSPRSRTYLDRGAAAHSCVLGGLARTPS